MLGVRVNISRYADDSFPGWVECRLVDALGHEHVFVEKVPVVTKAHLDAASTYPQSGVIACVVLGSRKSDDGGPQQSCSTNPSNLCAEVLGRAGP